MCIGGFVIFVVLVVASSSGSGAAVESANGEVSDQELWCVAKNNAEDAALRIALGWACGQGGANCRPVQKGGACYFTGDILTMASYAFNDYYLKNGLTNDSCYFGDAAAVTSLNPSKGKCKFSSSLTVKNGSLSGKPTTVGLGPVLPYEVLNGYGSVTTQWFQLSRFLHISNLVIVTSWILG